jgi:hypothetical protein
MRRQRNGHPTLPNRGSPFQDVAAKVRKGNGSPWAGCPPPSHAWGVGWKFADAERG